MLECPRSWEIVNNFNNTIVCPQVPLSPLLLYTAAWKMKTSSQQSFYDLRQNIVEKNIIENES